MPASGKYRIVTDYVVDPALNALLMKVAFTVTRKSNKSERPAPLPPLRSDRERQRRRRERERRRRLGDHGHLDRPHGPRRVRPEHGDERGQPRLRAAGLRRPRRTLRRGDERLRRDRQRRAHAARHLARADDVVHDGEQRQRRPDRAGLGRQEDETAATSTSPSRSASARARRTPCRPRRARCKTPVRPGARRLGARAGTPTTGGSTTRRDEAPGDQAEAGRRAARRRTT